MNRTDKQLLLIIILIFNLRLLLWNLINNKTEKLLINIIIYIIIYKVRLLVVYHYWLYMLSTHL